jgi:ribosome-associated protein
MPNVDFKLDGDFVELNQLLKLAGLCDSGGAGKMLVAQGQVSVDGKPESRKTAKIRSGQTVTCSGVRILVKSSSVSK